MTMNILPQPTGGTGGTGQSVTEPQRVVTVSGPISDADRLLLCDQAGPITLNLPSSADESSLFIIKDRDGDASTNPITIAAPLGSLIDGAPTYTLGAARRAIWIGRDAAGNFFVF